MNQEIMAWIEGATFVGATKAQILDLISTFETLAARPLSDVEVSALFHLTHKVTCTRACIDGVLQGRILVREDDEGRFEYAAAPA
jgi:hypothetical protein